MNEQFDLWNKTKKCINKDPTPKIYLNTREIWFTRMGKNVGYEEDGKTNFLRPVLVLKKVGNLFFTVALTSKGKDDHIFYHKFEEIELIKKNKKYLSTSFAILSQAKVMDKRRFVQHLGTISETEFRIVQKKLKNIFF